MSGIKSTGGRPGRSGVPLALFPILLLAVFVFHSLPSAPDAEFARAARISESAELSRRADEHIADCFQPSDDNMLAEERFDIGAFMLLLLKPVNPAHRPLPPTAELLLFLICLSAVLAGLTVPAFIRSAFSELFHLQGILKGSFPVRAGPLY